MKQGLILLFVLSCIPALSQKADQCGLDNDPALTPVEAAFLNNYLEERRNGFDFTDKKIIFTTGTSGHVKGSKCDYFNQVRSRENVAIGMIVPLTAKERVASGGYDAIVSYWTKRISSRRKRLILRESRSGSYFQHIPDSRRPREKYKREKLKIQGVISPPGHSQRNKE